MTARGRLLWSLLALPVALLAAAEASGWFFLRGPAEAALASRLGREVRIGEPFRLHFRRQIHLTAGGLWIAAPPGFAEPHLVKAEGVALALSYGDLFALRRLQAPLRLAAIAADRLDARLIRLPDGPATWLFDTGSERPPPQAEQFALGQWDVVLHDALLAADLAARASARQDSGPGAGAEIAGILRGQPLHARIHLPGGLPPALPGHTPTPVVSEGSIDYGELRLDFAGTIASPDHFSAKVAVRGPSLGILGRLADTPLPTTAPFRLEGIVAKEDSPLWQVTVTGARIGRSDLAGRFAFDPRPVPPRLDGRLTGRHFVLADLAPAFGTRDAEGAPVAPAHGRTLPHRALDLPSLTRLDARIAIDLEAVDLGATFRQPIAPLRASLILEGGRLTLADLDATTARGRLSGALAVDARDPLPRWEADLRWDGIRLDTWLKAAKAGPGDIRRQAASEPPPWFTGTLHGRTQLVGHGRSTAELLGSLDGRATVFVRRGSLSHLALEAAGLDVAQGLGLLLGGDDRQPVECAVADLEVRNGRLSPRVALVATPVTVVMADGSLDLAKEKLDLRFVAKPQNLSPVTLRTPIRLRGTFAAPRVAPEGGPLAARAAGALGLALINPLAALLPFVDPGERDSGACLRSLAGVRP